MINTSLFALFGRYKGDASLAGVLENIQRGTYKQFIDETREALASGDKELAAKLKKKLPAFTPQATYSGKRLDPHITRYNQLVVLDIDHVGERELERITPLATEAPYTVAYFRSPSGDGAKLIAYAATDETATPGNHRRVYEAMSRWYAARLGVELDTSGSDIGRLCFVSDDPALYLSPAYRPWLEGTGELPEGLAPLPLTWKEEVSETAPGAKERKVASPLEKARRTAERKGAYAEGNRNNFIFVMAARANRLGVKRAEMEAYAATAFADLPVEERLAAIESAYSHVEEHAAETSAATSTGVIYLRRPYGHYAETQIRHASFAATVNDLQSLPDDNESRRFLCFEATRIDYQSPVRHADIYAQALALFRRGEKYWFSGEDIRKINENNETFRQRSPEEELFFTYFRKPERFDTPQYLTASDIMTKLSVFTRITPTRSNIVTLSKVLKKHGFKLTKTRGKLLFEVAEITSEQVKANFLRPRQEEEDRAQKENDIFKGQEDKPE